MKLQIVTKKGKSQVACVLATLHSSTQVLILFIHLVSSTHEIPGQLHPHEDPGHEEAQQDTDEADEEQEEAVEFGDVGSIGAVQDYEAKAPHGE